MKINILRSFTKENLKSFYMGYAYPVLIAAIVLIGNITELEIFFNTVNFLLALTALWICDSIRPFIISLCTCHLQISISNTPFYPSRSDYFLSGWRFPFLIALVVLMLVSLLCFAFKNRLFQRISLKSTPLLIPLSVFSAALLLNGAFSSGWELDGFIFGLENAVVYLLLFLLIFHGFSESESGGELAKYFAYVTMLISIVISAEMLHLFITRRDIIFVNGSIMKDKIALGWGIWNLIGVSLSMLTPIIFYGMHKNKYPWLYFSAATVGYVMSVLTMSRNSLIFSSLTYAACVIVSCFVGKNKKLFRVITGAGVLAVIAGIIAFWSKIKSLLGDYFERGFSDNGRFEIWRTAFGNFVDHPIFGNGFSGLHIDGFVLAGPVPLMAHNTVLTLLSAMGIVGLIAYSYYVFAMAKSIFVKPNFEKSMLAFSVLTLMVQSLLDNFVFNLYPMFYCTVAVAIIFKCRSEGKSEVSHLPDPEV